MCKILSELILILSIIFFYCSYAIANEYTPQEKIWTVPQFLFHDGKVLKNMKIGYIELGNPSGEVILILHGTGGSAKKMLNNPNFGGSLFYKNQILDAKKYRIILIDSIGTGNSSKPSDGLKANFPNYNYKDMVLAQYRLVTEHLKIKHVRAIIGFSMGGMHTWLWGIEYPEFMDLIVPLASSPTAMSGRNYITRKFISDSIRKDPAWKNGNYTIQPKSAQFATIYYNFATNLGEHNLSKIAPNYIEANKLIDEAFAKPYNVDANDILYQWESSADYNPIEYRKIKAEILSINSADDERNPPELNAVKNALKEIGHGVEYLVPISDETYGHSTVGNANFWKHILQKVLSSTSTKI